MLLKTFIKLDLHLYSSAEVSHNVTLEFRERNAGGRDIRAENDLKRAVFCDRLTALDKVAK